MENDRSMGMSQSEANCAITAAKGSISVGGSVFLVDRMTHAVQGTVYQWVRKRQKSPMDDLIGKIANWPLRLQEAAISKAMEMDHRKELTQEQIWDTLSTHEGVAFLFWCLVRNNHPDLTYEGALEKVKSHDPTTLLGDLGEACKINEIAKN
jgi:hypothetical protein